MTEWKGFKPRQDLTGYTQIPNEFFDEALARIKNAAELKIVLAVFRKTYGWTDDNGCFKVTDRISYTQFEQLTGLSLGGISQGLKRAIADGYIEKVDTGHADGTAAEYRIRTLQEITSGKVLIKIPAHLSETDRREVIEKARKIYGRKDIPMSDKQALFEELMKSYPQGMVEPVGEKEKPKKQPKKATKERIDPEFTPQDLLAKFGFYFRKKYNIPYGSGKKVEFIKANYLLTQYSWDDLIAMIQWFFDNYETNEGFNKVDGPPNFHIFHGWRDHIFRSVKIGPKSKVPSQLQTRESHHDVADNSNLTGWGL